MQLVNDWKTLVRKAWSLRWNFVAFVIDGGSLVFYLLLGIVVPWWVTLFVLGCILAAMVSRIIYQPNMRPKSDDIDWSAEELPSTVNTAARRIMADVAKPASRKELRLGDDK